MNTPSFNIFTRGQALNNIKQSPEIYEAFIVGGGIVGASLSRELAIRGVKTFLAEKNDFASGTSSKSSKLIHGGLRYLEMGDFKLVFEALGERHWLLKTHPHLVKPIEFNIPIYKKGTAPKGAKGTLLIGIGLWAYDLLSLTRAPFLHGRRNRQDTLKNMPHLKEKGLKGSYYYPDAMMLDDEIVLENLLDATRRGAQCFNYLEVQHVSEKDRNGLYTITLIDTNPFSENHQSFTVKSKEVIVCAGPWTERIGANISGGAIKKLKPSKGIHLIVPWEKFPLEHCLVMGIADGRIMFAIPRKDFGSGAEVVIVGTTDSPDKNSPELSHANSQDVDYLFDILKEYFPTSSLCKADILMTYSGVRPLIDSGAESEAKTSREHEIWRNSEGIVFMAGGKYTTFRKISEEIADFSFPKTKGNSKESKKQLSTPEDYAKHLTGRTIWGKYTDTWVKWKCEHHCPVTLTDIVFRRMPLWMAGPLARPLIIDVANVSQGVLGWTEEQKKNEIKKCTEALDAGMHWE